MKRLTATSFFTIIGVVLILVLSSPAQAITIPMTMEDLTTGADAIIIGTIVEASSDYGSNHAIYTSVVVDVEEGLKGNIVRGNRIVISIQGGTIGTITDWVEDEPIFTANDAGKRVLAFLDKLTPERSYQKAASLQNSVYPIFQIYGHIFIVDDNSVDGYRWEVNGILKRITPGKPTASPTLTISENSTEANPTGNVPDNEYDPRQPVLANADATTATTNNFWTNAALYIAILVLLGALVVGLLIIRRRD
ncbi:MAG: hypothetical protein ACYDHZ_02015 [Dehalococcoidia bacterium]